MTNMLRHKGYVGLVNFDAETGIIHGEVVNIRDVITFQGESVDEVKRAFVDSVEDYLDFCRERGEEPEKPFSGKLILRMPPQTHQEVHLKARQAGISLNEWVNQAIEDQLARNKDG